MKFENARWVGAGPPPDVRRPRAGVRAFFALWPSDAERDALFAWAQACHAASGGRLVLRENLHVTVAFLGDVERSRLPELGPIAERSLGAPFALVLDRIGYWPYNRIVHAAATRTPAPLAALCATLTQALAQAGFRTEARPYRPHATLLRDARSAPAAVPVEPLVWPVGALVLAESARSQRGQLYRPLQRWTLPG